MSNTHHFDVVGSFLRPANLKNAKADLEAGKITELQYKTIKQNAIRELVEKQKKAGLHYITDGEYNRKFWHLDFFWGFDGIAHQKDGGGVQFAGEVTVMKSSRPFLLLLNFSSSLSFHRTSKRPASSTPQTMN